MTVITFNELPEAVRQLQVQLTKIEELILSSNKKSENCNDQPLNVEQCAEFLNLTKSTVYSMVSRGQLPHIKKGKRVYFFKETLLDYLQEGSVQTSQSIADTALNNLTKLRKR